MFGIIMIHQLPNLSIMLKDQTVTVRGQKILFHLNKLESGM